jgi:hypothetical protein
VLPVAAGSVARVGEVKIEARRGSEILLRYRDAVTAYPLHICEPRAPRDDVVVALRVVPDVRPAVVVEPVALPGGWPPLEDVPTTWGPTPVPFTTTGLRCIGDDHVLSHEVFACYPRKVLAGITGPLDLFVAPPIGRYGALVAVREGLVVCTLAIADAIERGEAAALAFAADLADLAAL